MKNAFYLLIITVLCACNSEKKETAQTVISTPTGMQGLQKSNTIQPVSQSSKTNLIFNPPHGAAGHTCALAVGAPLNQAAAAQPQQKLNQQANNTPATTQANTSGKKLNPKHGEPGHRCDIAIGAPLDSKPTQVVTTQPAVKQSIGIKTAKGLNPPHGQPNHRCDLAVGAPLNSKPVPSVNALPAQTPEVKTTETKVLESKGKGK
ncbi:hypothetical protein ASE74_01005 [Pedobacter sp. Leaf216]|uniref:hypothetical protein n=1 Tax=Pedobacter sp. Leaf216 TaxID=1735684 RepID=UPI0007000CDF|nr:hypothetical protein [Pedobacter sp. Leaf216]KQM79178.1 hypothetical protein ASE74_01005 [Pedobacter sp. Leaf216]